MGVAKVIQLLWALFFVLAIGLRAFASGSAAGVFIGVISVAYLAASVACLGNVRIGWTVALVIPILPLVRWTPMVVVNFWMFFTGHELYQDSPATIFIVAMNAFMFVLPSLLIYLCLALDRKRLFSVLWPTVTIEGDSHSPLPTVPARESTSPYTPPRA